MRTPFALSSPRVAGVVVFALALALYASFGTQGALVHDDAIFVQGGLEMLRGVPPYLGIFDHKGPLPPMLCAAGAWVGPLLGVDELAGIRGLFFVLSCATAVAVYALALELFRSRGQAFLAAVVFIAFTRFAYHATAGPRPKTPVVLCEVLVFLLCARRSWFAAGFAGALAGLAWQPAGVFALVAVVVAAFHCDEHRRARRAAGAALLGLATPLVLVSAYFLAAGAFYDLVEGAVLFNLRYVDASLSLWEIGEAIYLSSTGMGHPVALGLVAVPLIYAWRARAGPGPLGVLARDRFSAFLLAFPALVLWSLTDFQDYPDFFVFLPWAAVGFSWLLFEGLRGVSATLGARTATPNALAALASLVILAGAAYTFLYFRPGDDLDEQRAVAASIRERFGEDARIVAVGAPRMLVLLDLRGPTRYGFLMRGIDRQIEASFPGGFAGWLRAMDAASPEVLVVNPEIEGRMDLRFARLYREWLEDGYRLLDVPAGDYELHVPRDTPAPQAAGRG